MGLLGPIFLDGLGLDQAHYQPTKEDLRGCRPVGGKRHEALYAAAAAMTVDQDALHLVHLFIRGQVRQIFP